MTVGLEGEAEIVGTRLAVNDKQSNCQYPCHVVRAISAQPRRGSRGVSQGLPGFRLDMIREQLASLKDPLFAGKLKGPN